MTRGRGCLLVALMLLSGSVTSVEGHLATATSQKGPFPLLPCTLDPRKAASGLLYLMSVHLQRSRSQPNQVDRV